MSSKKLMAWLPNERYENTLTQHLLDTAVVAAGIEGIRKRIGALACRLEKTGLAGEDEVLSLIFSSLLLHDLGKGCSKHQESFRKRGREPSFPYHEVVSAIILTRSITESSRLRSLLGGDEIAPAIVYAVLSHHQAMGGRAIEVLHEGREELASNVVFKCGRLLAGELSYTLIELSENLPKALSNSMSQKIIERILEIVEEVRSSVCDLDLRSETLLLYSSLAEEEGGYELLRKFIENYDPRVWQLAYVASGITMTSDTLAASAERGGGVRGLTHSLLRELGIKIEDIDKILRGS